jgi:hypothetical protein
MSNKFEFVTRSKMTIEELKAKTSCTESKDISITFPSGQTRQFTGQSLLLGNMPNFFFHTTTAYNILRQCGSRLASVTLGFALSLFGIVLIR